jgi:small subunit ribosomal protein S2
MGGVPDIIFVIDTNKEQLAIKEAQRLGIPVAAIVDTNCDPDGITFAVPANDDAGRAIALYCDLVARAAIDGISRGQGASGVDLGEAEAPIVEELPVVAAAGDEPAADVFERLEAPRGAPDELTKIHGIGPELEKNINEAGVYHFWQLAAMSPADAEKLDADLKLSGRIARDNWVELARAAVAG